MNWFRKLASAPEVPGKLIIGLGNPGREYEMSRHNIGFLVVNRLAEKLGVKLNRVQSGAVLGKVKKEESCVMLAKPQMFMNNSGSPVSSLVRFYKISQENLLVIHDDVDLAFGYLRLRPGGSSPGHRGIDSIIHALQSQDFPRLRVGIGRPPGRMTTPDYVLERFLPGEMDLLEEVIDRGAAAVLEFVDHGIHAAMNKFNGMVE